MGEPGGLPSMGSQESDTTEATWQQQQQRSPSGLTHLELSLVRPELWLCIRSQELGCHFFFI